MNLYKQFSVVSLCLLISACETIYSEEGLFKDSSYQYLKAQQTKELVVSEPLFQKNKVDYSLVPAIGDKANEAPMGKEVRLKAPVQLLAVLENVRVNKQSVNPAVFVTEDSEFLWESFLDLMQTSEVRINVEDKANFLMETDWTAVDVRGLWLGFAGEDDIDDFRAKYRIRISDGYLNDEKQVEVERFAAESLNDDTDEWESTVSFWQDSAEMLNLLILNYDKRVVERDALAKENMIVGFTVKLANDDDGSAALVTDADMGSVWNKLPNVLEALNFKVHDKDQRLRTYFVKYEYDEPGFFATLFNSENKALPLESGDYQVTLRNFGELTAIIFRDGQGAPLDSVTLTKMYPELSNLFGNQR